MKINYIIILFGFRLMKSNYIFCEISDLEASETKCINFVNKYRGTYKPKWVNSEAILIKYLFYKLSNPIIFNGN